MDRQIKHLGHRVELDEIEVAALRIDGVDECCAVYNKEKEVIWLSTQARHRQGNRRKPEKTSSRLYGAEEAQKY